MTAITLNPAGCQRKLRFIAFRTVYHQMLCLLLLGAGCSWGVDLDGLVDRGHSFDASPGRDTSRDMVSVDRIHLAADLIGSMGGLRGENSDTGNRDARDSVASNESYPDSLGEDAPVHSDDGLETAGDAPVQCDVGLETAGDIPGDESLETAGDIPTDNTVSSRIDSTIKDTIGNPGDLAIEAPSTVTARACSGLPPVNATMVLSSAVSSVTGCGYPGSTLPLIHAAVDPNTFAASAACGMCILIQTAAATVEAMVVDLGPAAMAGNPTSIAVSRPAMDLLLPEGSTYVTQNVQWKATACTLGNSGMSFTFQRGSSANYTAVLVQNHRYGLAKVEYKNGTTFKSLLRMPYNVWVAPLGMGSGPFTLRMTDQFGQTVEQSGIPLVPGKIFSGESQFPLCSAN